eukprot:2011334-Rhodomonas_salina.1
MLRLHLSDQLRRLSLPPGSRPAQSAPHVASTAKLNASNRNSFTLRPRKAAAGIWFRSGAQLSSLSFRLTEGGREGGREEGVREGESKRVRGDIERKSVDENGGTRKCEEVK